MRPAISPAGLIATAARRSASSTGSSQNAKGRLRHSTCSVRQRFDAVPFFWSQHYDVPINYVGHAEKWDDLQTDGEIAKRDCVVRYLLNGRVQAVASVYRDRESLMAEVEMERGAA